jgi:hypothetical protein
LAENDYHWQWRVSSGKYKIGTFLILLSEIWIIFSVGKHEWGDNQKLIGKSQLVIQLIIAIYLKVFQTDDNGATEFWTCG